MNGDNNIMEEEMVKKCPNGSVGVIFERDGRYLVFFRRLSKPIPTSNGVVVFGPIGWAGVAGHLDDDSPMVAARREAREEVGVEISFIELVLGPETIRGGCKRDNYYAHEWYVYRALKWEGEPHIGEPDKHSDLRWVTLGELQRIFFNESCDPAWFYIFLKLGLISK